ncbi:VOC family protein [Cryptosporangium phraense]|uniref:Dioxygenase n=1 Tax=Cryptosporangium phraense TaxID=2593070 RepID=A0A545APD6_9ACTN|nr:VOC family protein [Cryptosporangium phraense]TQS43188.1 dioxygenase [Cryptosporangium phraense]
MTGFGPRRLAHVNLFVSDLERSTAFYTEVCGLDVVFEEPGISAVFLSNGTSHHDLALMEVTPGERVGRDGHVQVSRGRGRRAGLNHLGWEMASEAALVEAIHDVRGQGVKLHRTVDHQISRSAYVFDPDEVYLEFYCDAAEDWRVTYANNTGQLITGSWDPDAAPADASARYAESPTITVVEDAALRPVRTARASLIVSDLDAAVAFYTGVGGLSVLRRGEAGAVLGGSLGLPDLTLLVGTNPGLDHFGLELRDAVELAEGLARVRAAGVPVLHEESSPYKQSLVLVDPDGIRVEFLVPGEGALVTPGPESPFAI